MGAWEPGKILVVDDSKTVRKSVASVLEKQGHKVYEAQDGAKALWSLRSIPSMEIVLLDLEMPILDGLGLLHILRENDATRQLPVIMISSVEKNEKVVECLYAGANDFVRKPIVPEEIVVRVRNTLELSRTLRKLTDMSRTDHLTGLANKRHLETVLHGEMERSRRSGDHLGVVFADLDHFKKVNDNYGHQVGDEVLRLFSERLKHATRPYDNLFRYGGEEFVIVSPGSDAEGLFSLAERIRKAVAQEEFATSRENLKVTASLGCALFDPGADKNPDQLLTRADGALYNAKETGRNRVVVAE